MYNIAFIAYGSKSIGMGHLMRTMSLAKQFRKQNFHVIFITKYSEGIDKLKSNKFNIFELNNNIKINNLDFNYGTSEELDDDTKQISNFLKTNQIDCLIIDTYNISYNFFIELKKYVKCLIYIDDIYTFEYPVDILINGNITGEYMGYKKLFEEQKFLLGLKYNLIRNEFKNIPKRIINKDVNSIMITTGASDPKNITYKFLYSLINAKVFKDTIINVVIGSGFNNVIDIESLANNNENILLYRNPNNMSEIMLSSDIAIAAGGSTLYELSACGTPTIAFIYAENQRFIVEKMTELKYIKNIGYYDDIDYKNFIILLNELSNYEYRKEVSKKGQLLVDCKGTERVVSEVYNYLHCK